MRSPARERRELRGRSPLPDRDPLGRGAARVRGGARGGGQPGSTREAYLAGKRRDDAHRLGNPADGSARCYAGVEVSLFLGPRGAWDTGGQSFATGAAGGVARGHAGVEAPSLVIAEISSSVSIITPLPCETRRTSTPRLAASSSTASTPVAPRPRDLDSVADTVREALLAHARCPRRKYSRPITREALCPERLEGLRVAREGSTSRTSPPSIVNSRTWSSSSVRPSLVPRAR